MPGSDIFDVVLGFSVLCLGLALVSSILVELSSIFLNRRETSLYTGIRGLLNHDAGLTREFYRHPLVSSLYEGEYSEFNSSNRPSMIPARIFALALIDIAAGTAGPGSGKVPGAEGVTGVTAPYPYPSYPPNFPHPVPSNSILRFNIDLNLSANPETRRALLTLVAAAADDPVRSRENIEQWFEAAMESVANGYRRTTLIIVTAISIALAVFINADALALANNLATGKAVRSALIEVATMSTGRNSPGQASSPDKADNDFAAREMSDRLQTLALINSIQQTSPSLGWSGPLPRSAREWCAKISGFLLTGLAVSMIAPLWFRLWQRITNTTLTESNSRSAKPS